MLDILWAIFIGAILAGIVVYIGTLIIAFALFLTDPETLEQDDTERE